MAHLLSSSMDNKMALGIGMPVALLGCYGAYQWYRSRDLPPGPIGLPVVGRLPWLHPSQLHLCIEQMVNKYGDIISFRMGSQLMIAIGNYDMLKEMMNDDNYAARPRPPFLERLIQGCGIFNTEGESWTRQRRLALKSLRDFGFARTRSAEMVDVQLDLIFQLLEKSVEEKQSLRVIDAFTEATNGVIAQLTINRRFKQDEAEFKFLNRAIKSFFETPLFLSLPLLFPYLDPITRILPSADKFIQLVLEFHEFIREQIHIRESILVDESMEPECLCDVYIQEKRKAEKLGDFESYKELQIIRVILEFFMAGTDTTARSLEWLFVLMATHPDIQSKVQSELDQEVGSDRRVQTSDKPKLHFTNAVIEEAYRFVSLAVVGPFHRAKSEAVFNGYRIPKDAVIFPCAYISNHDPRIWSKPNEFYPEHFLDQKGVFTGPGKNVPFLIGRRACPGEGLARMEVFLMFTAIMQRYRVSLAPEFVGKEAKIVKGFISGLRTPGEHRLLFRPR
ncbi:hypothetical protein BOX15_Mlig015231g2 [Macrostomum lignano]|uniref:Cytochrome P450 n=1 Tax=Macrostomum lignano TaxID=282301 RepID=A0A267H8R7_9PLAT|nr:hypothetical protein BOX15_Mlig015231g2 [Macrostomum lignano]